MRTSFQIQSDITRVRSLKQECDKKEKQLLLELGNSLVQF
jgi:hypothetical protein